MKDQRGEFGRKGLSPLIATVLLIAFAAALGTMIMSWSAEVGQPDDTLDCSEIRIRLQDLGDGKTVCYDLTAQKLRLAVENTGKVAVTYLGVSATNESWGVTKNDFRIDLDPGKSTKLTLPYITTNLNNLVVRITPIVLVNEVKRACTERQVESLSVPYCS